MTGGCVRCGRLVKNGEEMTEVKIAQVRYEPWTQEAGIVRKIELVDALIHTSHIVEDEKRAQQSSAETIAHAITRASYRTPTPAPVYSPSGFPLATGMLLGATAGLAGYAIGAVLGS